MSWRASEHLTLPVGRSHSKKWRTAGAKHVEFGTEVY